MEVPNFFLCKSAVLSCFATGRSTALILDTGAQSTYSAPVHDGYVLQKNVQKYDIGGEFITEQILNHVEHDFKTPIVPRYNLEI